MNYNNRNFVESAKETFLYIILFIFLFTTGSPAYNVFKINVDVRITYTIIFLLLLAAFLISILKNKFDFISSLLFSRVIIFTITFMLFSNSIDTMPRYFAVIISFLSYSTFYNLRNNNEFFFKYIKIAYFIICVQTLTASFNALRMGEALNFIKVFIRIPLGGSNYIACFILMFLPIIWFNEKNKKSKYLLMLLGIIAIIMTRSNTGFFILSAFIISIIFKKIKPQNIIYGFLLIASFSGIMWIVNFFKNDFFDRYINVFTKLLNPESSSDLILASNGRFQLYTDSINLIRDNLLIGLGVNYIETLGALAHNIILESLLQAGIFNALILLTISIIILRNTFKNRKSPECLAVNISVTIVLFNGLIEPNLFAFNFDYFFWAICGFGMSKCRGIKSSKIYQTIELKEKERILLQ